MGTVGGVVGIGGGVFKEATACSIIFERPVLGCGGGVDVVDVVDFVVVVLPPLELPLGGGGDGGGGGREYV